MSVAAAMAVDLDMLADVLPAADAAIVKRYLPGEEGGGDE